MKITVYLFNSLFVLPLYISLLNRYENMDIALHYGAMLRECIRHQSIARYVLESEHMKKFFDYIQLPNFDIASDASATFKASCFTFYLSEYFSYSVDSSKNIQIEAFHVFKLFAANKNKPPEVVNILVTNRNKLLRFFAGFKIDKEDEQFEADKEHVIKEISAL
ncbi:Putative MO25-like protein [Zea mays]|uniref:Putative MO25-like protein n=1 Tax=Zea mays TaxID=4577 RepID=A0A1D6EZR2_MAIZE|nr:Putative MO25-like protein [Zea mays]